MTDSGIMLSGDRMACPFHELREILELQRETVHLLHRILKHLHPEPVFSFTSNRSKIWSAFQIDTDHT